MEIFFQLCWIGELTTVAGLWITAAVGVAILFDLRLAEEKFCDK